jgi:hypothetical protein
MQHAHPASGVTVACFINNATAQHSHRTTSLASLCIHKPPNNHQTSHGRALSRAPLAIDSPRDGHCLAKIGTAFAKYGLSYLHASLQY